MNGTPVRGLAASALLAASLLLGSCTAPTVPTPSASGAGSTATASPSSTPAPTTVASSGGPSATPTGTPASASPSASPATDLRGTNVGLLNAYDPVAGVLTIDVVYFLSGTEAVTYLAERPALWDNLECAAGPYTGGSTVGCAIPSDYYLVNENPRLRSLPLAAQARVKLIPWPDCCETAATTREALANRAATKPPLLISFDVAASGQITEVSEVYTP